MEHRKTMKMDKMKMSKKIDKLAKATTKRNESTKTIHGLVWFLCLSTLFRLFNAKAILLEEQ